MVDHKVMNDHVSPLPKTYLADSEIPSSFSWANLGGKSLLTSMLNQHIPQYCGSCWAHSALSSLADRIKIDRIIRKSDGSAKEKRTPGVGPDINLSIQFLLNCGSDIAGSCHGGSATGAYEFIKRWGYVPFETCMPYIACSKDSEEGFCPEVDTTCKPINICRTCTNPDRGGRCSEISRFPNATVAEYGTYHNDIFGTMAEIYVRGPVKASVNATPIQNYAGGIISDPDFANMGHNHGVSIVGWDTDAATGKRHWIVRNSWGQYWGEMGFFRVEMGQNLLGIEANIAWATPGYYSEFNFPCAEDGSNCSGDLAEKYYTDPSVDVAETKTKLAYLPQGKKN
uniref:Peptidase C1A papain C-terminal domain-containing protein n=1 Tax=Trieres chinensis TaxID=1514140 RepID=A0A7S1Z433_TRICV